MEDLQQRIRALDEELKSKQFAISDGAKAELAQLLDDARAAIGKPAPESTTPSKATLAERVRAFLLKEEALHPRLTAVVTDFLDELKKAGV